MQINLNQLRTFFLVAKEKSITRAAHVLHITQPAVTMQIKAFEKNLDVKLLRKSGKELQLTDMGNVLYSYAERIFQVVEELEYALKGYGDLTQGSLTIGTTRSFARHLMPGLLSRFQERFPNVKVYLKVGSSQEIADGFPGVEKSFAVQAGREVRILVRPDEIDDLASGRLARDIVRQIEETLTYPGQIKVTVIRETRSVEYAK